MKTQIKYLLIFILILILILLVISLFQTSVFRKLPSSPAPISPSERFELSPAKITIEIWNGKIQPNRLTLKAGQEIFLTIVSMEGKHSIVFEGPGLSWLHANFDEPGETLQFHLFAPAQGEYHFFCQEPNHRESGEEGVIIVE
jgi:plastocyanin